MKMKKDYIMDGNRIADCMSNAERFIQFIKNRRGGFQMSRQNQKKRDPVKLIPVDAARRIAEEYAQDQVVICTFENTTGRVHVVTYGKHIEDAENAAKGGDFVKKALGWPGRFCNSTPPRVQVLADALTQAVGLIRTWHNMGADCMPEITLNAAWNIYFNCSPEMKPIREALELLSAG